MAGYKSLSSEEFEEPELRDIYDLSSADASALASASSSAMSLDSASASGMVDKQGGDAAFKAGAKAGAAAAAVAKLLAERAAEYERRNAEVRRALAEDEDAEAAQSAAARRAIDEASRSDDDARHEQIIESLRADAEQGSRMSNRYLEQKRKKSRR